MKKIIIYSSLFLPSSALAFSLSSSNFKQTITYVVSFINALIPVLFLAAFIIFFWGLSKFILHSDNQENVKKGRDYMMWGILALFILLTFRTITGLISNDLGFGNSTVIPYLNTCPTQPCP